MTVPLAIPAPVMPASANLTANATAQLQEAVTAYAASVLYVLLLLPSLARNQSIGYAPPYFAAPAAFPAAAAAAGYPAYGYPAGIPGYPAGYPALGAGAGLPPLYGSAGSLPGTPPYGGVAAGAGSQLAGYGFPAGWPARPLGPLAAALATAYPTLFAALTGPCRSWCRAPNAALLFPPSAADSGQELQELQEPFPWSLLALADRGRDRPVLRVLRTMLRGRDEHVHDERGPVLRLLFPEDR